MTTTSEPKSKFRQEIDKHRAAGLDWHAAYDRAIETATNEYVAELRERGTSEADINNILAKVVESATATKRTEADA